MATTNKFKDRFISLLSIDSDYKPTDPELLEKINTKGTLSYNDIGQKIGVSAQAIDNWINNRANPKTSNVEKIAALFGVSTSWLLGYEDAVLTEDTETYNHFAKYGFSYKAFSALKRLRDNCNPSWADTMMKDYVSGINTLLEYSLTSGENDGIDCILLLNTFFRTSYGHTVEVDLDDIQDLQEELDNDRYEDDPKEIIQYYFERLISTGATDPVKADLSNLSKLSETLKKIKLSNARKELLRIICNATKDSNADLNTTLSEEQLDTLSPDDKIIYHNLKKLCVFYSD